MKRKSLSTIVFESLLEQIRSGALGPGEQLPTETELCEAHSVSRTVVREALARLRSEGLVIPRQGKGVFVSEAPMLSFTIPDKDLESLPQTLALLELRLAVEVEAAGLAAQRRTEAEATTIRTEMERVDSPQSHPTEPPVHYDYDLHLAIARATHNPQIIDFLSYLRGILVPHLQLGYVVDPTVRASYFARIHTEHEAIVSAIEARDEKGAREAMRVHLNNSLGRLRALSQAKGRDERARAAQA
ncbi:FadR/GntR family transcriptional regulator [Pararhodobacter sp. CCB-MM2]|uniref:FadR/GntR family transcriptional regulator n=1 Tax=Pararhodobacter sp. CCB-MM2 TaxID=1786003 RepID=UPI00082EFB2A|nr:FadR/GntR family transcriptional regulator [Pararhodobacter sp. CCB-MM2]